MPSQTVQLTAAWITAAGACLAAFIAGIVALLNLRISKETEVSKFRQIWIDELRNDVASLIAHSHLIHAYISLNRKNAAVFDTREFWRATREDYIELNKASTRIKLRLNPNECDSRLILQSMSELETLFGGALFDADPAQTLVSIQGIADALERNMPPLLKREWNRVKAGELTYRITQWFTVGVVVVTLLLFIWFVHGLWTLARS